jgi:hypothetical protein
MTVLNVMFYSMNSIVRVGDCDGLYVEQWNLSGDRRVSIVPRDFGNIYLTYSTSNCLSKTGIRSFDLCLCLFWLFMNIRPVLCLVFGWIINCPCLSFICFASSCCKNRTNVTFKSMPTANSLKFKNSCNCWNYLGSDEFIDLYIDYST